MTSKKRISILLMGGLGNQIFQLTKAKYFQDLGFYVTIDTSNFKKNKENENQLFIHRKQVFPIEYFNFEETNFFEKKFYSLFYNPKIINLLPKSLKLVNEINDYSQLEINFSIVNKAIGYWQDIELLRKYKHYVISSLKNNQYLAKVLNNERATPGSTVLHIRRGDYLNINEQLSEKFYINCLNYCEKNISDFSFEVFTDDYNYASKSKVFTNASKIHKSNSSVDNTIKDFSLMLNKENYIVGNSTFSLLAAVLSETSNSKILYANPWFRNKSKDLNFDSNWVGIENIF